MTEGPGISADGTYAIRSGKVRTISLDSRFTE